MVTPLRDELLRLREEQRRLVRALPDSFLGDVASPVDDPEPDPRVDRADVELYVRQRAEEALTPDAREVLELLHSDRMMTAATKRLHRVDPGRLASGTDVARRAIGRLPNGTREATDALRPSLRGFALLAIVADDFAEDGYRDPAVHTLVP